MADLSIQKAFKNGMNTVFLKMFDMLSFRLLDRETTSLNTYRESPNKKYKSPVLLAGKLNLSLLPGEQPVEGMEVKVRITVPTKQLEERLIAYASEGDQNNLKGAKFTYDNTEYIVDKATPNTFVAGAWLTVVFECTVDKKSSLKG